MPGHDEWMTLSRLPPRSYSYISMCFPWSENGAVVRRSDQRKHKEIRDCGNSHLWMKPLACAQSLSSYIYSFSVSWLGAALRLIHDVRAIAQIFISLNCPRTQIKMNDQGTYSGTILKEMSAIAPRSGLTGSQWPGFVLLCFCPVIVRYAPASQPECPSGVSPQNAGPVTTCSFFLSLYGPACGR